MRGAFCLFLDFTGHLYFQYSSESEAASFNIFLMKMKHSIRRQFQPQHLKQDSPMQLTIDHMHNQDFSFMPAQSAGEVMIGRQFQNEEMNLIYRSVEGLQFQTPEIYKSKQLPEQASSFIQDYNYQLRGNHPYNKVTVGQLIEQNISKAQFPRSNKTVLVPNRQSQNPTSVYNSLEQFKKLKGNIQPSRNQPQTSLTLHQNLTQTTATTHQQPYSQATSRFKLLNTSKALQDQSNSQVELMNISQDYVLPAYSQLQSQRDLNTSQGTSRVMKNKIFNIPSLVTNFGPPQRLACDSPQASSSFAEVTMWSRAQDTVRMRNQVSQAVERSFCDPKNWQSHQIHEVRAKPQDAQKPLELSVPQKQRIVLSKWPHFQSKERQQSGKKESPRASQQSFVASKEIAKKKKKAKFEIIPQDEREPTLAEFIQMNQSTEYPIDKHLLGQRSAESIFNDFKLQPPPHIVKHQELQRDFNRKLETMNNSINKEINVINTNFGHNIKYLIDAQSNKKEIRGLPKRVIGRRGFEHVNSRYLVNNNVSEENVDNNLPQGPIDYSNIVSNNNASRNNRSSLKNHGQRSKNNHTFLNHKNKYSPNAFQKSSCVQFQFLTMNNHTQHGKRASRNSSAGHKNQAQQLAQRKQSGVYMLNQDKNFYEKGPMTECLPNPKLEDYRLTYNMY